MFDDLIKDNHEFKKALQEAFDEVNALPDQAKLKIQTAFRMLNELWFKPSVEEVNHEVQKKVSKSYKDADAEMDDAASALTAMSGIDVRKDGACEALAKIIRTKESKDKAKAIELMIQYHIAKSVKDMINE